MGIEANNILVAANAVDIAHRVAKLAKQSGADYEIRVVTGLDSPLFMAPTSRRKKRSKYAPRIDTPKIERKKQEKCK